MKKKFAALFCAAVLAAGLPSIAFAGYYNSPSGQGTSEANGVSVVVTGGGFSGTDEGIYVGPADVAASNVPSGVTPIASFEIGLAWTGDASQGKATVDAEHPLTITFNVGASNAGKTVTVYVQHDDGTFETMTSTVASDGSVTITVTKLSIYSIVLSDASAAVTTTADKSAKSPQTGADMGFAFGGAVVAMAGASCAAYALRKKIAE